MRGLFFEGLIFGGAYLRREICVAKSIGLALWLEVNLPFLLCFTFYLRAIFQVQAPVGAYIWRGDLTEGFLRYRFGGLFLEGLIHGGASFRNFIACGSLQTVRLYISISIVSFSVLLNMSKGARFNF